jgi:HSP20 family molecular chaperone IbpA
MGSVPCTGAELAPSWDAVRARRDASGNRHPQKTENEYVIELEVPGYAEKELTIEVSDHMLTVMS